tara:strand:- start:1986 stop:2681 length:696 start_codon:yes stop_codon:yes gene_type:complete
MNDTINFKFIPLPSVYLMEVETPDDFVNDLNTYLDKLLKKQDRKTNADTLVGQIHNGEQLRMDHLCEELEEVRYILCNLAAKYVAEFLRHTGQSLENDRQVEIDELWSVHSYAGDYNPIHDHGTQTAMGVSCTTWTKVPSQISKLKAPEEGMSYFNSSGCVDGFLEFVFGRNSVLDKERLMPVQDCVIKPTVGRLYFFPSWLQHMVYPFRGKGERRTVAANFNCFPSEKKE